MSSVTSAGSVAPLSCGAVVELVESLWGVESPDGLRVDRERLRPGVIEVVTDDGAVLVHWYGAGLTLWMDPDEVCSLGADTHLVNVYNCDASGNRTLLSRRVVANAGLSHNWIVELLPDGNLLVERADGRVWTSVRPRHDLPVSLMPPHGGTLIPGHGADFLSSEDDDSEALLAARLSLA